jgi:hypothetical protein
MRREKDGKRVGGLGGLGGILGLEVEERVHSPNLADRPVFNDIEFLESALLEVLIDVRTVDQRVVIARGKELIKLVAKFRSIVAVLGNNGDARSLWQEEPRWRCLESRIGRLASTGKDPEQTQNQRAGGVECLKHGMNARCTNLAGCLRLSRRNGFVNIKDFASPTSTLLRRITFEIDQTAEKFDFWNIKILHNSNEQSLLHCFDCLSPILHEPRRRLYLSEMWHRFLW